MSALELAGVGSGFSDPVFDSQAVFRGCLAALSTPGTIVSLEAAMDPIPGVHLAAGMLLMALLDQDTRLWLSPAAERSRVAAHLKFHTGCALAASPAEADFALVAGPQELPSLDAFSAGTEEFPERSAIVVVQVPELRGAGWRLSGPGIRDEARLSAPALGAQFIAQWERNQMRFPRGVDLYLVSGDRLCGLPRTTRIEA